MTATLVKKPAAKRPAPSQEQIEFAAAVVGGLKGLLHAVAENPEIAPLVAYGLRNMCSPQDSQQAIEAAARAMASEGAVIERADDGGLLGVTARFGPQVCMWLCTPDPDAPVKATVEADSPAEDNDAEASEAEVPADEESAEADTETETTTEEPAEVAA